MSLLKIHDTRTTDKEPDNENIDDVAISIDLGTSNCVVSFFNEKTQQIEIIPIDQSNLLPSVIVYKDGNFIVGKNAKNLETSELVFKSMKRFMGKSFTDLKDISDIWFDINEQRSDKTIAINLPDNKVVVLEEIIAEILKKIKISAQEYLNKEIKKAVITVPAYFDEAARVATKNASYLAGLEVLRLINEPTAAAFAYGLDENIEGVYVVYDFGGGTFDVSILKLQKGIFRVLSTLGDLSLGGDDIDLLIYNKIITDLSLVDTTELNKQTLLEVAKSLKQDFSNSDHVSKEFILDNTKYIFELTLSEFENIISPVLDRTIKITKQSIQDSDISLEDITSIILVGGSSKLRGLSDKLRSTFNIETLCSLNPDEVVSIGASYQAANLTGRGKDSALLLDVIPLSLGLEIAGGIVEKIIPRNSTIPIAKAQEFTTSKDGQTSMMIHVLQGERELVKDLRSLGKFTLKGIPPMVAGATRIKVLFSVDTDGLLRVSAQEEITKIQQEIEIKPTWGLSIDDMRFMIENSMIHAQDDINNRLLSEIKVEANAVINHLQVALAEDKDVISDDYVAKIKNTIKILKDALEDSDRDLIQNIISNLDKLTIDFAHKRMEKNIQLALQGKSVSEAEDIVKKALK